MITTDPDYAILTAMLAPAFFMTATGSLLISASNRLARVVDRLRQLMKEMEQSTDQDELEWLDHRISRQRRRSRLILRANQLLYLSLSLFVGTSLMVMLDVFLPSPAGALPTTFAGLGVLGLGRKAGGKAGRGGGEKGDLTHGRLRGRRECEH